MPFDLSMSQRATVLGHAHRPGHVEHVGGTTRAPNAQPPSLSDRFRRCHGCRFSATSARKTLEKGFSDHDSAPVDLQSGKEGLDPLSEKSISI